ncbi:MAG: VCBS repeat-containing protein, partial [Balneolaceae bacterium]
HTHHEDPFEDFELQAFLPVRLSQMGPGVSWIDITGNGYDDLLIGSGKGGKPGVYRNLGNGEFEPWNLDIISEVVSGDQTTLLGWKEDGNTRVVIGSANYEQGRSGVGSAYTYKIDRSGNIASMDSLSGVHSTTGPLAAADVTGNGYLDLFAGGSFKPGQYPKDADSRLFRNNGNRFIEDRSVSQLFSELGMVNGAVFSDLTRNDRQDLLVSTSWGSLRLFENTNGILREITSEAGLDKYKGWWHGVATGDFTGNGRPDIIALNIGRNSQYQLHHGDPIRMYYDDIDGFGSTDIIEAYSIGDGTYVPRRKLHGFQQQQIRLNRMSNHSEFANSTLKEILGSQQYDQMPYKEINTIEHMIFLNTETGFEAHALPVEAQFSPGFSAATADVNNDGHEDIFISQNLFAFPQLTPRLDAGRGQVLLGDGSGGFKPMNGTESGIKVYG